MFPGGERGIPKGCLIIIYGRSFRSTYAQCLCNYLERACGASSEELCDIDEIGETRKTRRTRNPRFCRR